MRTSLDDVVNSINSQAKDLGVIAFTTVEYRQREVFCSGTVVEQKAQEDLKTPQIAGPETTLLVSVFGNRLIPNS